MKELFQRDPFKPMFVMAADNAATEKLGFGAKMQTPKLSRCGSWNVLQNKNRRLPY